MIRSIFVIAISMLLIFPPIGENNFFESGIIEENLWNTGINIDSSSSLPEKFSWRNVNGTDFTTSIKNQEPCPSCEAYALVAALETMVQYKAGHPFGCDLSEAHLFFCSGGTCKRGVNVSHAADYLVEYGVPDEGCFPDPHRKEDVPCNMSLPDWGNRTVKIKDWGWIENDGEEIKKALIEHGPLVICIWIWNDFMYYHGGIYKHRWGRPVWGHLITIVGYDDEQQCWICKNSWGENWGEGGWIRIAYDADMFIPGCYGGTGILYVDGVYGNLMPDVPKVYIEEPKRYHVYVYGKEFFSPLGIVFTRMRPPRIIGYASVKINATNAEKVEFYVDDELRYIDEEPPFSWHIKNVAMGFHTIEVFAYNEKGKISKDMIDIFVYFCCWS